jgi:hypothetical protein
MPSDPLLEFYSVSDVFSTELSRIDALGPCSRLIFAVQQRDHDGRTERIVVAKIVLPTRALAAMSQALQNGNCLFQFDEQPSDPRPLAN